MSGLFDNYKGEQYPIVKNAELLNVPFKILRMKDRENVESQYGTKDSMLCTIEIAETGEKLTYFGENKAVYSKLKWLQHEVKDISNYTLKLIKVKSGAGNEYFDIVEADE